MYLSSLTTRIAGRGADGFRVSDRAASLIARGADVVSLTLGDPDFDTPAPVIEAGIRALRSGRTHYTPVAGEDALRVAIATSQAREDGLPWTRDNVVVFPGAQSALFSTMLCIAEAGRSVVTFDPLYATYEAVVGASGARLVRVPVEIPFGLGAAPRIDMDGLDRLIPPDASAILLNSPNNPGGYVFDEATVRGLAQLCVARNLWLVSDEVYRDLVFDGRHVGAAALPGMAERTVIVNSLSKSHAMTGWRIGWAIAPAPLSQALERVAQCSLFGSPPFVQDAAVEALVNGATSVVRFRETFRSRRDALLDALSRSEDLRASLPAGGMFTLVDVSASGLGSGLFAERALDEAGVAVVPGTAFSARGDGFVRVSFAQSEEVLAEGGRRLAAFARRVASDT